MKDMLMKLISNKSLYLKILAGLIIIIAIIVIGSCCKSTKYGNS